MSNDAQSKLTTHDDGKFVRTAIVIGGTESIDLVAQDGTLLARINVVFLPNSEAGEHLIVDVIDVADRYKSRRMLAFSQTERVISVVPEGGKLVSADFQGVK